MKKPFKFVIIGSGNIANTYASAIKNIHNVDLVAIVSRNLNKLSGHPEIPTFKTLQEINIDYSAVIICTPNGYHHIGATEAAALEKHVLCEKPLEINLEAADRMIKACKDRSLKLGVTYQRRVSADNPIVKQLIENNMLGKIFSVNLSILNWRDDAYYESASYRGTWNIDGGGPFIQQASHYIDLYTWFFGMPNKLVSKLETFMHDIEVEDHGAVLCTHPSGMIGTITASTATKPGFPSKLEIFTSKGYLVMENDIITQWAIEGMDNPSKAHENVNSHSGAASAMVNDTINHEIIIKDFIEAVQTNRSPMITGESAKLSTEVILAIYKNQL